MADKWKIGPLTAGPVGLGCMSLSHAYGTPPPEADGIALLNHALDIGYDFLDTAALYGFGANETLIGKAVGARRGEFLLASKCGMTGVDGARVIDGRPETLLRTIDEALRRLGVDVIDLYYLHRLDPNVAVEESVGAMGEMVAAGKVRAIGLSEVSAETLRRAHAVHPIAAVQNEYSPWSRNVELGVLQATAELGTALVCFSPVARGFLAGSVKSADALEEGDIRRAMPRFQGENFNSNIALQAAFAGIADEAGCSAAQLSLAWVLSRGDHVFVIPGTTRVRHLEENLVAAQIALSPDQIARIDALFAPDKVQGDRYNATNMKEINTERFG